MASASIAVMTQSQFISRLDVMKRRARIIVAATMVICIGTIIANFCLMAYIRSHSKHGHTLLLWLSLIYTSPVLVYLFWIPRVLLRHSPKCPACDKRLTFREKSFVITNKACPFCAAPIIDDAA